MNLLYTSTLMSAPALALFNLGAGEVTLLIILMSFIFVGSLVRGSGGLNSGGWTNLRQRRRHPLMGWIIAAIILFAIFGDLRGLVMALAVLGLMVYALVDCGKRLNAADEKLRTNLIIWLVVILVAPGLGALVYLIVHHTGQSAMPPRSSGPSAPLPGMPPINPPSGQNPPSPPPDAPPPNPPPPANVFNQAFNPPPVVPPPANRPKGQCPKCGAPLDADAPEGLCPRCLLQVQLGAPTQFSGAAAAGMAASFPTSPPPPPPAPQDIAQHFPQLEILECLGRGGMGVVYKARQPRLNRIVALKILAPGRQNDPQFAERFLREAQALARLSHPNLVTVHDFGESGGLYYLLMEYVDGVTLRGLLHNGKIEPAQALAIVPRICEALQYAHEQGVVHRDIKPENVLIDKQGRVKIADFGLARMLGAEGLPAHTRDRYVMGTPYYMAPEQVEHPLEVDHRADIYSLGVVFYEMLTGELPLGRFASPSQKVQVDVRLDDVVLRALEKEPQRRYQQAGQVKTDVENISGMSTGSPAPVPGIALGVPPGPSVSTPPPFAAAPSVPPTPAPEPPAHSHFSGKAIAGLLWMVLGTLVAVALLANQPPSGRAMVPMWASLFGLMALSTPLGVTTLGWIAVGDIVRSRGRISGLWLAVFDGLIFPLVALDALVTLACYLFTIAAWGSNEGVPDRFIAMFGLFSLLGSLGADLLVVLLVAGAVRHARDRHLAMPSSAVVPPPDLAEAKLAVHSAGTALCIVGWVDIGFAIFLLVMACLVAFGANVMLPHINLIHVNVGGVAFF